MKEGGMDVVAFEDALWRQFLPLVYFRSVGHLVCGGHALIDRVDALAGDEDRAGLWCRESIAPWLGELSTRRINAPVASEEALFLNARGLWRTLPARRGEGNWVGMCEDGRHVAALHLTGETVKQVTPDILRDPERLSGIVEDLDRLDVSNNVQMFQWPWELVLANPTCIVEDWDPALTSVDGHLDDGCYLLGEKIHVGGTSRIKPCAVIDAENGPVWIGEGVTVQPHSYIQGPTVIGDNCLIQAGAKIRAGTTIGERCKVGGEIEGTIFQGFSNKQHDGFLGHSYVAEWVNLAANSVNSDLKNTYGTIRVPICGTEVDTGEQFVGALIGDHSKAGINTAFPTGAVVGVCSSIFASLSPKFVPSFTWIDGERHTEFDVEKGLSIARTVMQRRDWEVSEAYERLFRSVAETAREIERPPADRRR